MHRCVYLTVHITKLQLQTTFPKPLYIYHIVHVFMGTLATENLVGFVADIDIKILRVAPSPPLGAGHAFPRQRHMHREEGVIYFCQGFLPYMMPSMDG